CAAAAALLDGVARAGGGNAQPIGAEVRDNNGHTTDATIRAALVAVKYEGQRARVACAERASEVVTIFVELTAAFLRERAGDAQKGQILRLETCYQPCLAEAACAG